MSRATNFLLDAAEVGRFRREVVAGPDGEILGVGVGSGPTVERSVVVRPLAIRRIRSLAASSRRGPAPGRRDRRRGHG